MPPYVEVLSFEELKEAEERLGVNTDFARLIEDHVPKCRRDVGYEDLPEYGGVACHEDRDFSRIDADELRFTSLDKLFR